MNGTNYEVPHCGAVSTPRSHPYWAQIFASGFCFRKFPYISVAFCFVVAFTSVIFSVLEPIISAIFSVLFKLNELSFIPRFNLSLLACPGIP